MSLGMHACHLGGVQASDMRRRSLFPAIMSQLAQWVVFFPVNFSIICFWGFFLIFFNLLYNLCPLCGHAGTILLGLPVRAALGGPTKRAVRGRRDGLCLGEPLGFAPGGRDLSLLGVLRQDEAGIHPSRDTPCTERGQGTCPFLSASPFGFPFLVAGVTLLLPCSQPVEGGLGQAAHCLGWVMSLGDRVGEGEP